MTSTLALLAQFGPDRGGRGGGVLLALILAPIVVALVAYGIVQLTRGNALRTATTMPGAVPPAPVVGTPSSANVILDERFARGEIDRDTYLAAVDTLRQAYTPPPAPAAPVVEPAAEASTEPTPVVEAPTEPTPVVEAPPESTPPGAPES